MRGLEPLRERMGEGSLTPSAGRELFGRVRATYAGGRPAFGFSVAEYFTRAGRASFYTEVVIQLNIGKGGEHYHVPLLLSPFGYSTYRGS